MKRYAEIYAIYDAVKPLIEKRIASFKKIWKTGSDEDIFCELVFCLMTPQSKAKSAGAALEILKKNNLIMHGGSEEISAKINIVRFRNNKARYIVAARTLFLENGRLAVKNILSAEGDPRQMREWLVNNIIGYGYKEASHFLRNIGFGARLAILDRHIIRNMIEYGVIDAPVKTLTPKAYLNLEKKLLAFSERLNIPPDHLDFVLWYKEAGDIYK